MQAGKYRVVWINFLIALAMTLMLNFAFLLLMEHPSRGPYVYPAKFILVQVAYFFVVSWLLLMLNTLNKWSFTRKIIISVFLIVALYFLIPNFSRGTGEWGVQFNNPRLYNPFQVLRCSFVMVVSILYGKIYELLYQKQHVVLENEQLKNENLQNRYNLLANQISPHFLFNSLNSLTMLVREGQEEKTIAYIDRLADTFRYTLQSGQNEMTKLSDELRFTEAYLYLLMIRYESKLSCSIEVNEQYMKWCLPAMTLLPLIENAVKHNSITRAQPFSISITNQGEKLVVSNPLMPKLEPAEGTGIGLKNLSQRYQLLTNQTIKVKKTDEAFTVVLPLIKPRPE